MNFKDYIEMLEQVSKDLEQLNNFYSLDYITDKEYLKIEHRIVDKISKVSEFYQEQLEGEINKL